MFLTALKQKALKAYDQSISRPLLMLLGILIVLAAILPGSRYFSFDASADTLVVQGDPDLEFYQQVLAKFGGDEFMLMTVTPPGDLLSAEVLQLLANLEKELDVIEGVRGVLSLLDAPLLRSPPVPITDLISGGIKQLDSPGVDLKLAREELLSSPLFRDLLISADGRSTALRIDLEVDTELQRLRERRNLLRDDPERSAQFSQAKKDYTLYRAKFLDHRVALINQIRAVRDRYQNQATLHIGGVPMIASDMIEFIKDDISVFGIAILMVMLVVLYWFFRHPVWVILPLATAALSNLLVVGILGYIGQAATVVSSNFVALLAITSVALNIHLIVRYQELRRLKPDATHKDLVLEAIHHKFAPCLYTALTTMVAFASLSSSAILPVEAFGWIMVIGIACAMFVIFTFFPALLLLFPPNKPGVKNSLDDRLIKGMSEASIKGARPILLTSLLLTLVVGLGISMVTLDNRFLDYFKEGTDIREGLLFVDQNLGGTIPFEVIVRFPPWEPEPFDEEDDFASDQGEDDFPQKYWFTADKIARLGALHRYIESQPGVGKTLSLATFELIARDFTDGKPLDSLLLVAILDNVPATLRKEFVLPYAHPEDGLMRISGRIVESGPFFSRNQLVENIENYALRELGFAEQEVRTTGMMVMFNNMLEQLLRSQTSTISYVLLAVLAMFLLLLKDIRLAIIGLLPNILAPAAVLAVMGYVGWPLNMLTITIAAISIGIGIDGAIHYLHRYRIELERNNPVEAIKATHKGVGSAIYYTTITVIAGFVTLSLSNFIPNVTFGLLTGLAMLFGLLANLVIVPALLLVFYRKTNA